MDINNFFPPEWGAGRDAHRKGMPRHRNPYVDWFGGEWASWWYSGWDYEDALSKVEERRAA
jgi:hypothetical protein